MFANHRIRGDLPGRMGRPDPDPHRELPRPLPVALGSLLALWVVAALAVASGQTLLRFLSITTIRKITAIALLCLAWHTFWTALS